MASNARQRRPKLQWHSGIASFTSELEAMEEHTHLSKFDNVVWDPSAPPTAAEMTNPKGTGTGSVPIPAKLLREPLPIQAGDVVVLLWSPMRPGVPSLVADLGADDARGEHLRSTTTDIATFGQLLQRVHDRVSVAVPKRFAANVYGTIGTFRSSEDRRRLVDKFELTTLTLLDLLSPSGGGKIDSTCFAGQLARSPGGVWTFETV